MTSLGTFRRRSTSTHLRRAACTLAATTALTTMSISAAPFTLAETPSQSTRASIVETIDVTDRLLLLQVTSAAMGRDVPVNVIVPADRSEARGVYYLLDGNSGQVDTTNWLDPRRGNAEEFFADKNAYVVMPVGGTGSLYSPEVRQDEVGDVPDRGTALGHRCAVRYQWT